MKVFRLWGRCLWLFRQGPLPQFQANQQYTLQAHKVPVIDAVLPLTEQMEEELFLGQCKVSQLSTLKKIQIPTTKHLRRNSSVRFKRVPKTRRRLAKTN